MDFKEATIIDVREEFEYDLGHVEGSKNIPLGTIPEKIEEIREMQKPIILCCASGNRSGQATTFLQMNGLENVHNGGSWKTVELNM